MKKAQITIFLVLAIVIALIFGFLFYVVNNFGTDKSSDKLYEEFLTTSNLKENVQNCLEISTKKAIMLAGLQGGRLYDWQLGKVVDPHLTFYMPFNQNQSITWDYVNGNNGTLRNTNWIAHGRFNGAYQLHGDGYVEVDDNNLLDFGTDKNFSILAWFKTNNIADQAILAKGDAYQLYIHNNKAACKIGGGATPISVESSSLVTDGLWHSVACTINRTGNLTLYVDGSAQISKQISPLNLSNSDKLLIGKNGSDYFDGTIDDIALFNKTLNGRQIHTYTNSPVWAYITANEMVPFTYNLTTYNVSYGIVAPVEGMDRFHLPVPAYPYSGPLVTNPVQTFNPSHNISNPSSVLIDYGGLLAYQNKFYPPWKQLCNSNGPNVINFSGVPYSCEVYSYSAINYSIQNDLREYILAKTSSCIDFDYFVSKFSFNISQGNLTGDILFGDTDVYSFITYPLTIDVAGKPPITKFESFNFRLPIRFKKLYEFVKHSIGIGSNPEGEADNVFFDIVHDETNDCKGSSPCRLPGFFVNESYNYCATSGGCNNLDTHYNQSHVLVVQDTNSTIDGVPLTFLIAVENRRPVLDLISDISVHTRSNITISPQGIDPDDEDITYHYSGWQTPDIIDVGGSSYGGSPSNCWENSTNYQPTALEAQR